MLSRIVVSRSTVRCRSSRCGIRSSSSVYAGCPGEHAKFLAIELPSVISATGVSHLLPRLGEQGPLPLAWEHGPLACPENRRDAGAPRGCTRTPVELHWPPDKRTPYCIVPSMAL